MRVLVCGGRDFSDSLFISGVLENFHAHDEYQDWVIIEGGARGVDTFAKKWAERTYIPVLEYKADWNKHGKAAGPIRNQQMLDEGKPDLVIAFPGGRGTADMVSRAKKANIPVEEVGYDKLP